MLPGIPPSGTNGRFRRITKAEIHSQTPTDFALAKSQGAKVDDPVIYGAQSEGNVLFTINEVATDENRRYLCVLKVTPLHLMSTSTNRTVTTSYD